jgi:hypothetical protein
MVAVRRVAKERDERVGILGADGAVERKARSVAEGLERKARADAVGGVGAGIERVDAEIQAAVVEGFEVMDVGVGAGLAGGREFAAERGLFGVTDDENGVAGEVILRGGSVGGRFSVKRC